MAKDLIPQYREGLAGVREAIRRTQARAAQREDKAVADRARVDLALLHGMEGDVVWTLTYLTWGQPPPDNGPRVIPMDPQRALVRMADRRGGIRQGVRVIKRRRQQMDTLRGAMKTLTRREREAVKMIVGDGLSYGTAAKYLEVSKASVQSYVSRGLTKLNGALGESCHTVDAIL